MCVLPGNSQSDECSSHSWKFSKFIKALDKHFKVRFLHFNLSSFLNKQSPWVHQSFQENFPFKHSPISSYFFSLLQYSTRATRVARGTSCSRVRSTWWSTARAPSQRSRKVTTLANWHSSTTRPGKKNPPQQKKDEEKRKTSDWINQREGGFGDIFSPTLRGVHLPWFRGFFFIGLVPLPVIRPPSARSHKFNCFLNGIYAVPVAERRR